MRILWLAPEPPIPPLSGGRERARRMFEALAARHDVHLLTFASDDDLAGLRDLRPDLAGLEAIKYGRWAALCRFGRLMVRNLRPGAMHVQGADLWRCVPRRYDGLRVYDCHDAPVLPLGQRTRLRGPIDDIIAVSEADRDRLCTLYPNSRVVVLPNGVDLDTWQPLPAHEGPPTLLFPAALNWGPNVDAARALIAEVLPPLQQRVSGVQIVIAGRLPGPALRRLADAHPAVTLIANPPDMRPLFAQATAIAVPTAQASGTRLKILQALAADRPVISTPEGAHGLGVEAGKHLLVAPLVEPFVEETVRLLTQSELQSELVEAGRALAATRDWKQYLPVLETVYP